MAKDTYDLTRCIETVFSDRGQSWQCSRKRTIGAYCQQHHPDSKKRRREASAAKFDARAHQRDMNRKVYEENIREQGRDEGYAEAIADVIVWLQWNSSIREGEKIAEWLRKGVVFRKKTEKNRE